jgi:hypothetical protein
MLKFGPPPVAVMPGPCSYLILLFLCHTAVRTLELPAENIFSFQFRTSKSIHMYQGGVREDTDDDILTLLLNTVNNATGLKDGVACLIK